MPLKKINLTTVLLATAFTASFAQHISRVWPSIIPGTFHLVIEQ